MRIKGIIIILVLCLIGLTIPSYQPKIAIVYIATGRYIDFWDTFYNSAEKNFVPDTPKHYFVLTDDTNRTFPDNVTRIYQKQLGWPYITLLRYYLVDRIKDKLAPYDYTFFFNANAVVVDKLGTEILPDRKHKLVAVKHPIYHNTDPQYCPYENRVESTAFVPHNQRKFYFQTGFSGGRTNAYLKMNALLKKRVQTDLNNGIIAVWHDESHYNWFMAQKNPLILEPNYIFGSNLHPKTVKKFAPLLKIIMLDKANALWGGHTCLRGQTTCARPYDYTKVISGKLMYVINKEWIDWLEWQENKTVCRFNTTHCAQATLTDGTLIVQWPAKTETFRQTAADFVFVQKEPL